MVGVSPEYPPVTLAVAWGKERKMLNRVQQDMGRALPKAKRK
jgi:hypothetical protein